MKRLVICSCVLAILALPVTAGDLVLPLDDVPIRGGTPPALAFDSDGALVAACGDFAERECFVRRLDAQLFPVGDVIAIPVPTVVRPGVLELAPVDGGFLLVAGGREFFVWTLDSQGNPTDGPHDVSSPDGGIVAPAAASGDGTFALAHGDLSGIGPAQAYSSSVNTEGTFLQDWGIIAPKRVDDPFDLVLGDVASLDLARSENGFVATWVDGTGVFGAGSGLQICDLDRNGRPLNTDTEIAPIAACPGAPTTVGIGRWQFVLYSLGCTEPQAHLTLRIRGQRRLDDAIALDVPGFPRILDAAASGARIGVAAHGGFRTPVAFFEIDSLGTVLREPVEVDAGPIDLYFSELIVEPNPVGGFTLGWTGRGAEGPGVYLEHR